MKKVIGFFSLLLLPLVIASQENPDFQIKIFVYPDIGSIENYGETFEVNFYKEPNSNEYFSPPTSINLSKDVGKAVLQLSFLHGDQYFRPDTIETTYTTKFQKSNFQEIIVYNDNPSESSTAFLNLSFQSGEFALKLDVTLPVHWLEPIRYFGETEFVDGTDLPKDTKPEEPAPQPAAAHFYAIQAFATNAWPNSDKIDRLKKFGNVYEVRSDSSNLIRFRIGPFPEKSLALAVLPDIQALHPRAFLVKEINPDFASPSFAEIAKDEAPGTGIAEEQTEYITEATVQPFTDRNSYPDSGSTSTIYRSITTEMTTQDTSKIPTPGSSVPTVVSGDSAKSTYFSVQVAARTSENFEPYFALEQFGPLFRVWEDHLIKIRVGQFNDREEAVALEERLVTMGYKNPFVVAMDEDTQVRVIVTPSVSLTDKGPVSHTVQSGETLFGIAKTYGLSVEELRSLNNLAKGDVIRRGRVLKLN